MTNISYRAPVDGNFLVWQRFLWALWSVWQSVAIDDDNCTQYKLKVSSRIFIIINIVCNFHQAEQFWNNCLSFFCYILCWELFHCFWFSPDGSQHGKCKVHCFFDQHPENYDADAEAEAGEADADEADADDGDDEADADDDDNYDWFFTWMTRDWLERRIPPLPLVFGCSRLSWSS